MSLREAFRHAMYMPIAHRLLHRRRWPEHDGDTRLGCNFVALAITLFFGRSGRHRRPRRMKGYGYDGIAI